jgi:hypothetical protein
MSVVFIEINNIAVNIADEFQSAAEFAHTYDIFLGGEESMVVIQPNIFILTEEVISIKQLECVEIP